MKKDIFIPKFDRPIRIPMHIILKRAEPESIFVWEKVNIKLSFFIPININHRDILKLQVFGGRNNKGEFLNIQCDNPSEDGFISVKYKNNVLKISRDENCIGTITIFPPDGGIKNGSILHVVMKNVKSPKYRLLNKSFILYKGILQEQNGPHKGETVWNEYNQEKILGACIIHILGQKIHHLDIYAPSIIKPKEKFFLLIRPEDKFHNLSSEIPMEKIEVFVNNKKLKGIIKKVKNSTCLRFKTDLGKPGIYRLKVKYKNKSFVSNPIICSDRKKYNLYWGMLHAHTEMSDGAGSIDYYFHQLKNEAALDFGAPGDHDHTWETTDKMWENICKIVKKWNNPGKFVTFLGYEWAKWRRNGDGDRNVYYYYDNRKIYRSDDGHYPNPPELFKALKKEKCIIIPHHTAHGGNFCDFKDHDKEKERLIEIYQRRGSYECSKKDGNPVPECQSIWPPFERGYIKDALIAGWRVGFTGGGDDHIGHAGTGFPGGRCNYKDGLTGVFATELTRKGIWDGLWNRRTIATTGDRIFLYYTVNNYPLGSEINAKKARKRIFNIIFHGTDTLNKIEIIRNGNVVVSWDEKTKDLELYWEDNTPPEQIFLSPTKFSKEPFIFYYIRAIQKNKEVVWASPVWIIDSD
ncbi:MAG: DUF3604 domain-containing protein [Thermoplasmata archaeon]